MSENEKEKMNPNQIGNISESKVLARALELGYEVSVPFGDNARYDLILDAEGTLTRAQVKTGRLKEGAIQFQSCYIADRYSRKDYTEQDIDVFAVYCPENDTCYVVPVGLCASRATSLRLHAARNNQKQGIRLAKDFEFNGAVAQLGERFGGIEEVRGSSPRSSTSLEDEQAAWQQAGAESFYRVERELEGSATFKDNLDALKKELSRIEEEGAQVSDEMTEDGLTGRALELADLVSDMIWGGERGWERANNEQFAHLKREARKRMKVQNGQ